MATSWLLLRGLAREQRHWHGLRERLVARLGAAEIVLVDVAGVGTEHRRLPRPAVEWLASDVARRVPGFADAAGPDGTAKRWSILGLSLGGMIALELCRSHPERIRRGLIINASSRLTGASARLRPGAALGLLHASLSRDAIGRERRILELTSALPERERDSYAIRAAELAQDAPVSRWSVLAQLLAAARFVPPERAALSARLRFVSARNDALVSPRCTRDLAAWYGAEHDEHPWAGHDLPLDDPEWLCDRVSQLSAEDEGSR